MALTTERDIILILGLMRVTIERDLSVQYLAKANKFNLILANQICKVDTFNSNQICCLAEKSDNVFFIPVGSIEEKCILIPHVNEEFCILKLANRYERD